MPEKKKSEQKKLNFLTRWWRETMGELRRVTWPTPQEAWRLTKVVVVVMLLMSALLGALDLGFSRIIAFILS
jgi:preprotein translocase subunit SecE